MMIMITVMIRMIMMITIMVNEDNKKNDSNIGKRGGGEAK